MPTKKEDGDFGSLIDYVFLDCSQLEGRSSNEERTSSKNCTNDCLRWHWIGC